MLITLFALAVNQISAAINPSARIVDRISNAASRSLSVDRISASNNLFCNSSSATFLVWLLFYELRIKSINSVGVIPFKTPLRALSMILVDIEMMCVR